MATTSSLPRGNLTDALKGTLKATLIIAEESGARAGRVLRVPLRPSSAWLERLVPFEGGGVSEDGRYSFALELVGIEGVGEDGATDAAATPSEIGTAGGSRVADLTAIPGGPRAARGLRTASLCINGEVVARGAEVWRRGDTTFVSFDETEVERPFALVFGYARAEVVLELGPDTYAGGVSVGGDVQGRGLREASADGSERDSQDLEFFSEDIPVLVRGSRELEVERVQRMYETLFAGAGDPVLALMLTGAPSEGNRFSIVEGGVVANLPRSLSTFLQMTERVLAGFEERLPAFRIRAASKVSRSVQRIPRNKVSQLGPMEALWIARNPDVLERVAGPSPITNGRESYLPRFVETERRTRTYDIYENRVVVAFLGQVTARLQALLALFDTGEQLEQRVNRTLGQENGEDYVLSSLLVADASRQRRERLSKTLERLARWAKRLEGDYRRAVPGVARISFVPPRRSKIFQEVVLYGSLYELMQMWCDFGDVDVSGVNLAFRTQRMDTLYEYYVLHELLAGLREAGFMPDQNEEEPVSVVRYTDRGQFGQASEEVANKYLLRRGADRVQLFYQPVFGAGLEEENGVTLHRTTQSGHDAPYTPDILLRLSIGGGPWRDFVLDAKYATVGSVWGRVRGTAFGSSSKMFDCLRKYRLECVASDTGCPPVAVWLLCGREHENDVRCYEGSTWARLQARGGFVPSGAASVSPLANEVGQVLGFLGIAAKTCANIGSDVPLGLSAPVVSGAYTGSEASFGSGLPVGSDLPIGSSLPISPEVSTSSGRTRAQFSFSGGSEDFGDAVNPVGFAKLGKSAEPYDSPQPAEPAKSAKRTEPVANTATPRESLGPGLGEPPEPDRPQAHKNRIAQVELAFVASTSSASETIRTAATEAAPGQGATPERDAGRSDAKRSGAQKNVPVEHDVAKRGKHSKRVKRAKSSKPGKNVRVASEEGSNQGKPRPDASRGATNPQPVSSGRARKPKSKSWQSYEPLVVELVELVGEEAFGVDWAMRNLRMSMPLLRRNLTNASQVKDYVSISLGADDDSAAFMYARLLPQKVNLLKRIVERLRKESHTGPQG